VLYFMTVRTPEECLAGPLPKAPIPKGLAKVERL
jgi:hypothetical protein